MARGASFRSRSGETVSSGGYEVIVRRPRSRREKEREREVRRSLDGDERHLRGDRDVWRHLCAVTRRMARMIGVVRG